MQKLATFYGFCLSDADHDLGAHARVRGAQFVLPTGCLEKLCVTGCFFMVSKPQ